MAKGFSIDAQVRDLESPTAVRGFGSGWFSGFFALLLGIAGFGMVAQRAGGKAGGVNFAIHFPWLDRLLGTYHMPEGRWPRDYGVPEKVPSGYWAQLAYPFRRSKG